MHKILQFSYRILHTNFHIYFMIYKIGHICVLSISVHTRISEYNRSFDLYPNLYLRSAQNVYLLQLYFFPQKIFLSNVNMHFGIKYISFLLSLKPDRLDCSRHTQKNNKKKTHLVSHYMSLITVIFGRDTFSWILLPLSYA